MHDTLHRTVPEGKHGGLKSVLLQYKFWSQALSGVHCGVQFPQQLLLGQSQLSVYTRENNRNGSTKISSVYQTLCCGSCL